jgi:hypothetical protein
MSEQTETGPIRYFNSKTQLLEVDPYLRGEEAGLIWLALHKQIQDSLYSPDPLSKSERGLYESLTTKFTELAQIGPMLVEYNEIEPNESND